jgi:integrase
MAQLRAACKGQGAELVLVLGLAGLRWGELAGLRVGDVISVPGRGLRVQRAVLASRGGGELYVDSVKSGRARTVRLVAELIPIVERWTEGKDPSDWLFHAPEGGPLRESNWKRSIGWAAAIAQIGVPTLRVHDLRHTAASLWLASGADPKVVQAVLGHATATMTIDLYGHLMADNLWEAAARIGGTSGARAANPPTETSGNAPRPTL